MDQSERLDRLEKQVLSLKMELEKKRKKRDPSEYNNFLSKKVKEIAIKNPDITSQEAFKKAVKLWQLQKEQHDIEEKSKVSPERKFKIKEEDDSSFVSVSRSESRAESGSGSGSGSRKKR